MTKKYYMKNYNEEYVMKKGFKKMMGYDCDGCYIYKFPVLKYKSKPTLECIVIVDIDKHYVKVDVKDLNTNTFYAPYYQNIFGNSSVILEKIYKSMNKKFNILGIKRTKKK